MTRPDWDLPDEWEVARRATGGSGRAASVGNGCVFWLARCVLTPLRVVRWLFTVERTEKEER